MNILKDLIDLESNYNFNPAYYLCLRRTIEDLDDIALDEEIALISCFCNNPLIERTIII